MSETITDYTELHTGDVICYNDMKLVVIYLSSNGYYNVECLGVAKEDKVKILDGVCNIGIRWNMHTIVERLGHISFSKIINNALKEYEEETKKEI